MGRRGGSGDRYDSLVVFVILALSVSLLTGCRGTDRLAGTQSPSIHLIHCPTGKAEDEIPVQFWGDWAQANLRTGDILFAMGDARVCFELVPFSKLSAAMAESQYSHTGIISRENGQVFIYDLTPKGTRRIPFPEYLSCDRVEVFAVKRLKPRFRDSIAAAIRYCQKVHEQQVPFDLKFLLDDDRLYCTELTEKAYRISGTPLSEPIRIDQLPRYDEFPIITRFGLPLYSIRGHHKIFIPGNEKIGIWSSPKLELVYKAELLGYEERLTEPLTPTLSPEGRGGFVLGSNKQWIEEDESADQCLWTPDSALLRKQVTE